MVDAFLHGSNTIEKTDGLRPVRTPNSAIIGATGTLYNALEGAFDQRNGIDTVVVRVEEGADIAANPVVAELLGIADDLRATIIADGPNTDKSAAVAYRDGATVIEPASSRIAGLMAQMDHVHGAHHSPSNQIINGITGTARQISFRLDSTATEANFLNENEVASIINHQGWRLWGNRTASSDPLWAFLSVVRMVDLVYDAIEDATFWALDKPFSAQFLVDIAEQALHRNEVLLQRLHPRFRR